MANFYARYSGIFGGSGGGGGGGSGVTIYPNLSAFPVSAPVGTLAIAADTGILYEFFGGSWQVLAQLGGAGVGSAFQEVPAGSGVNFTVTHSITSVNAFVLFRDGLILEQGTDYTIAGTNIVLSTALLPAQTLLAIYNIPTGATPLITAVSNTSSISLTAPGGVLSADLNFNIVGTRASPILITAAGGIAFTSTAYFSREYIAGSGGPVIVTASPQIAAGTVEGQELCLQGRSAVNTVELQDGNGLSLNGIWVCGLDSVMTLNWDGANWVEKCRQ